MLIEVLNFLRRSRIAETTFGRRVANDPNFVRDLRRGRTPRPGTAAKIRDYIQSYRGEQ